MILANVDAILIPLHCKNPAALLIERGSIRSSTPFSDSTTSVAIAQTGTVSVWLAVRGLEKHQFKPVEG